MKWIKKIARDEKGMELVQVAILVAIAIGVGLFFKTQISEFVHDIFEGLVGSNFSDV